MLLPEKAACSSKFSYCKLCLNSYAKTYEWRTKSVYVHKKTESTKIWLNESSFKKWCQQKYQMGEILLLTNMLPLDCSKYEMYEMLVLDSQMMYKMFIHGYLDNTFIIKLQKPCAKNFIIK